MEESRRRELVFWLTLVRGPALHGDIVRNMAGLSALPERLLCGDPDALRAIGFGTDAIEGFRRPDRPGIEADLRWLEGERRHLIAITDPHYPVLLRNIPDPPPALFVHGDPAALRCAQLAIVGSRNPSADGRRLAFEFAGEMARHGVATTSGLAIGIDRHAHLGALHGDGITIAVLGSGPDIVYPDSNRELAERIVERGAVVSEYPVGASPYAQNFPRRNRIISGLSAGTLVVEAALRSGSLITARHALDQGREVFAIPSSIRNPMARGCHALLKQGAKLVEQAGDILEEIGVLANGSPDVPIAELAHAAESKPLDEEIKLLLDNIGFQPVHIDCLIEATRLPAPVAASRLSAMEVAGLIEALPGGNYARR